MNFSHIARIEKFWTKKTIAAVVVLWPLSMLTILGSPPGYLVGAGIGNLVTILVVLLVIKFIHAKVKADFSEADSSSDTAGS